MWPNMKWLCEKRCRNVPAFVEVGGTAPELVTIVWATASIGDSGGRNELARFNPPASKRAISPQGAMPAMTMHPLDHLGTNIAACTPVSYWNGLHAPLAADPYPFDIRGDFHQVCCDPFPRDANLLQYGFEGGTTPTESLCQPIHPRIRRIPLAASFCKRPAVLLWRPCSDRPPWPT